MLCYVTLQYIILYYIANYMILFCILYYIVLFYIILYYTILYYIILYYIILRYFILLYIPHHILYIICLNTTKYTLLLQYMWQEIFICFERLFYCFLIAASIVTKQYSYNSCYWEILNFGSPIRRFSVLLFLLKFNCFILSRCISVA